MSILLRIELIVGAIFFLYIVIRNVSGKNLELKYSIIWSSASLILLLLSIFPGIAYRASNLIGIHTPSNLIFLIVIIFLISLCFWFAIIISKQERKINLIIQELSIDINEKQNEEE